MSKLACDCGYVIRDQSDQLPDKAVLLKDQDEDFFYGKVCADLAAFAQARKDGTRASWIAEHFLPVYPGSLSDADVIHDYLSGVIADLMVSMFECVKCGAVWIEKGDQPNAFVGYKPEVPGKRGILASKRASRS